MNQVNHSLSERLKMAPPVKKFRIGEVAQYSGLSRQTVHNYTIMGLIREADWSAGGHRLYEEGVFETLARIESLKQSNTLREIRMMLERERNDLPESDDDTEPFLDTSFVS